MDVVNAILKHVVDVLMVPVKEHLGYMVSCTKYVRDMDLKMKELEDARKNVEEHVKRNNSKYHEIPSEVDGWLKEVDEVIKKKVENNRIDVGGCFNLKIKHKVGRQAFKITEEIKSLKTRHELINWTTDPIPLGKVVSMIASTSSPSTHRQDFESREMTFMEALKRLDPSHESCMIALCGMGGVGKTTMMQDLKKVVKEKRMFSFIVEAVIGEKTDPIAIQGAIAECFSITLNEETKLKRGERLQKCFEGQSEGGKNKVLVILDDVWESVDLNDIGLSPSPNQGAGFKVLLTSRNRDVCKTMGVKGSSIIDVKLLTDPEAQELFLKNVKDSTDADMDPDFQRIGDQIVRKCQGLPLVIKTIACYLRGQSKATWDDALHCLELGDTTDILPKIFDMSYNNLNNENQLVFLLCGLYPEDYSIPTEDLVRYGWGLKLFNGVNAIQQARNKVNKCIEQLRHANLLIGTDGAGWVKMHDLVRAFVLSITSKGEHASIVNHGSMAEFPSTSESCKRLSLTCKDMSNSHGEDFKYPNLAILKLMHGDNLLRHAQDLYEGMENLQVIAYERTHYLAFSRSLQCSTTLRTLCLEHCSLTFDYSVIGNLLNLEVLSFSHSCIRKLPSIFGKLIKLKLLDLTGCDSLRIDSGVLKDLVNLEELYARVRDTGSFGGVTEDRKAISFSNDSSNDLVECSKKLSTLEVELFENNAQPMDMSFEKLERFNISLRCFSKNMGENLLPSENKLMLVTSKGELLGSRMNELFKKTKVLYLQVSDMYDLEEVDVDAKSLHPPKQSLFFNLRFLSVSGCIELRNLFTPRVATALSMLEDLQISSCPNLETLIHCKSNCLEKITFPKMKRLILRDLTQLSSLCHTSNMIELPQLIELELYSLPKITDIYPQNKSTMSSMSSNISTVQPLLKEEIKISMLRNITVESCDSLVNLFPINPMPLISNLEDLQVRCCGSIEALFYMDLGCLVEIEGGRSSLKAIEVSKLQKLKEVWRVKGVNNSNLPIHSFQALESLKIEDCRSFRKLFTPTTCGFDLGALSSISMVKVGKINGLAAINQQEEMVDKSTKEIVEVNKRIPNVAISSKVMFEIEIEGAANSIELENKQQALLLPYLKHIELKEADEMHHVWKCTNWNKLFTLQQLPNSAFHNLMNISLVNCKSMKYLFSPLMFQRLFNLKHVKLEECEGIEEVVSNRDDEDNEMSCASISTHSNSTFLPLLDNLELDCLNSLWHIGGGGTAVAGGLTTISSGNIIATASIDYELQRHTQVGVPFCWSLCQYSRKITIYGCDALSSLIPYHALSHMHNLEKLDINGCYSMSEVFESQRLPSMIAVPRLRNLNKVTISFCNRLRYLFTFSTLESLKKLKRLDISHCINIQVIVKEEDGVDTSKVVVFPCLKSVILTHLPNLEGFFQGMNEFQWHLLEKVEITHCPKVTRFTHGHSTSPMLKYIKTEFGKYSSPECGLNFHITTALQETSFSSPDGSDLRPSLQTLTWSFSSLIEIHILGSGGLRNNYIVPYNELQHLEKLERIYVFDKYGVEEVFETLKRTNSGSDEPLPLVINIPNLRELSLHILPRLESIFKSNQWTTLEFPNLTRLSIGSCNSLGHVLSCSLVASLLQLQELTISNCSAMKIVLKEKEECDDKLEQIVFPSLKSLDLRKLSNLEGFYLGGHDFQWPSLLTLKIKKCSKLKVFTNGKSTAPRLKLIDTEFGTFDAKEDPNTIISITKARGTLIGERLLR